MSVKLCARLALSASFLASATVHPAMAASTAEKEAIAACDLQRTPFVQVRERNREQTSGKSLGGALLGALAGVAAGSQVRNDNGGSSTTAMVIGGLAGATAGGYLGYLDAKRQIAKDNRELVSMIERDARGYATRIEAMVGSIRSTGKCRQEQITTWSLRLDATRREFSAREAARAEALAAAVDDKQRKSVKKSNDRQAKDDAKVMKQLDVERGLIETAIRDDKKLQDDVLKYFDIDIAGMAQAQAEVEGTSTASLLGGIEGYVVEVRPPAILASLGSSAGSTSSAFGTSGSAFGGAPSPVTPAPAPVSPNTAGDGPEPWEAVIVKPSTSPENGHQAAYVAKQDARAEADAATQSALARLAMVYQGAPADPS